MSVVEPAAGTPVGVVGSEANLLVSDDGFRGLVLKLDGEPARIDRDGGRLRQGGGVPMNANASGGAVARTLESVPVGTAAELG